MPSSCCAVNCSNRSSTTSELSFYRIPGTKQTQKRLLWLNAIKREEWPEELIENARICSAHFISGKRVVF